MKTLIEINEKAPDDATHYLPDSTDNYECWLKEGYSMHVKTQTDWVPDTEAIKDINDGLAFKIVK
jgi:hypothetical protein